MKYYESKDIPKYVSDGGNESVTLLKYCVNASILWKALTFEYLSIHRNIWYNTIKIRIQKDSNLE